MKRLQIFYTLTLSLTLLVSCNDDFLDKKSDKSLAIPQSLDDFQSLLDNSALIFNRDPMLGLIGSDDYFLTDNQWVALLTSTERNGYIWADEVYETQSVSDWSVPYQQVFYANVVLDGLKDLTPNESNIHGYNQLKGSALFYRAMAFYNLAQVFAPVYNAASASSDPGIPIRLTSDINSPVVRASVQETYNQIIGDLNDAVTLLPEEVQFKSRPYKATTYALLARTYLSMSDFENAEANADSCLQLYNTLLDYNTLNAALARPIPQLNAEVLFQSIQIPYGFRNSALINAELYQQYASDDLRKVIFFNNSALGGVTFGGTYTGAISTFGGIAIDELYLIRAECRARAGEINEALDDLNTLLVKRWKSGTFVPFMVGTSEEALNLILIERRKELVFRGLRWTDLRRLNLEPQFAQTLTRQLNGNSYNLPPNDSRYVYPIPQNEIAASGIDQNPR
jgi:starch-binding outer membrane protein, SusD/RagB family